MKTYDELPSYIASWDVAMLPFARNDLHAIHQPDEDARYSRRWASGCIDFYSRCDLPIRECRSGLYR